LTGTGTVIALAQGALGAGLVALGSTRSLPVAAGVMVLVGLAVALQLATTNGFLQVIAPPRLRGRLVSLYIWLFVGMSPLGGLAAGWLAERVGAPRTAWVAGVACLASAVVTPSAMARRRPDPPGAR
jgi:MFS family permease